MSDEEVDHAVRAHSRFSASGSERWLNCAYSVEAEAGLPDQSNIWALRGTLAHEVLECILKGLPLPDHFDIDDAMIAHCEKAAQKIKAIHKAFGGKLFIEKRVYAMFIDPDMFGTCDAIIITEDRTLHILDFKFADNHIYHADKNTQLIQYAMSVAESYGWEAKFDTIKMWILQPRCGKDWHKSWSITTKELKEYWLPLWEKGVARVNKGGNKPFPGKWCHWCKAPRHNRCSAKSNTRLQKVVDGFKTNPLNEKDVNNYGFKKESVKEKGFKKGVKFGKIGEIETED